MRVHVAAMGRHATMPTIITHSQPGSWRRIDTKLEHHGARGLASDSI